MVWLTRASGLPDVSSPLESGVLDTSGLTWPGMWPPGANNVFLVQLPKLINTLILLLLLFLSLLLALLIFMLI